MDIKFIEITKESKKFETISFSTKFKEFKHNHTIGEKIYLDRNILSIDHSLYGKDKRSTIKIWRQNCKTIRKTYKFLCRIIHWLRQKDQLFDGTFYVNTKSKLNNNDFMLEKMLDLKFKRLHFFRLTQSLEIGCEFLKKESTLNNMCDFKSNVCTNFRAKGQNRDVGCCSKKCKFCAPSECKQINISCRLYLCNFLIEKGYYFDHLSLPVFKQNLSLFDRIVTRGVLFMSTKACFRFAWIVRLLTCILLLSIILLPSISIVKFLIT